MPAVPALKLSSKRRWSIVFFSRPLPDSWSVKLSGKVARFQQINLDNPLTHHNVFPTASDNAMLAAGCSALLLQSISQCLMPVLDH